MDNNGLAVIYVCLGEYINQQLDVNTNELIHHFTHEDLVVKISGCFLTWRVVSAGSGPLLQFETPITTGEVNLKQLDENIL